MNKYRTHNCLELSEKDINKSVHFLVGFIEKEITEIYFIDLRDHYGMMQCVIENKNNFFSNIRKNKTRVGFKNKWQSSEKIGWD